MSTRRENAKYAVSHWAPNSKVRKVKLLKVKAIYVQCPYCGVENRLDPNVQHFDEVGFKCTKCTKLFTISKTAQLNLPGGILDIILNIFKNN